MRRGDRVLRCAVCVALAAICVVLGSMAWQRTLPGRNQVQLVCTDGITMARTEQIYASEREKEDGIAFTAWRECPDRAVRAASGRGSVYTDVLELYGSSELVLTVGKTLHREDVEGCLIGETLAEKLFGNRDAEGLVLEYAGRRLTVRGVFREPGMYLVVQAVDKNTVFDRITLEEEPGSTKNRTAQRFVSVYGLDADWLCYELFGAEYFKERIPGKWSDFAGWRQNMEQMREDIRRAMSVKKSRIELIWFRDVGKAAVLWGIGALLSACFCLKGEFCLVVQQAPAVDDQKDPGGETGN